jgi:hypothetical protein
MAALTATRISSFQVDQPIPLGAAHLEFWRIPAGSTSDTATIVVAGRQVITALGTPSLTFVITNSSIVFTLTANQAGTTEAWLLVGD